MYSDLIIGYDGSEASRDALALGRHLAVATGARTVVVHAYPFTPLSAVIPPEGRVELTLRGAAERVLDGAREALADVPGASFRAVPDASPARALHTVAEEADAALIVLGSTHRGDLGSVLLGTTADQTLHAAPCAVAVAPVGYAERAGKGIGVVGAALDGGEDTERIARVGARIARGVRATLRLIMVIPGAEETAPQMAGIGLGAWLNVLREQATATLERGAAAAGNGLPLERRCREGRPAGELVSESHGLDLLVIGSRGFGPLRRVILGGVSSKVVRHAACPVLVIPRGTAEQLDEVVAPLAQAAAAR